MTDTFSIPPEQAKQRLDKLLVELCPDYSRSYLKQLILDGAIKIDGTVCTTPSFKVAGGSSLVFDLPELKEYEPEAENIPLDILYEDDDLLVINKQAGLVVHPGAGNWTGTLVNALLHHCGDTLSGIGGVRRPGIVHRLDKDTSGLMVAAKRDKAHRKLSAQLASRTLSRIYLALVLKCPAPLKGKVDKPIGRHPVSRTKMAIDYKRGRDAVTHYTVKKNYNDALSLIECKLESGRTHQIRVHMTSIKHPIIGDPLYYAQKTEIEGALRKGSYSEEIIKETLSFPRQALHAHKISFIHPNSGEEMHFQAPLPDDFMQLLNLF